MSNIEKMYIRARTKAWGSFAVSGLAFYIAMWSLDHFPGSSEAALIVFVVFLLMWFSLGWYFIVYAFPAYKDLQREIK